MNAGPRESERRRSIYDRAKREAAGVSLSARGVGRQITTRGYKSPSGRNRERSNLRNGPVIRPSSHAHRDVQSTYILIYLRAEERSALARSARTRAAHTDAELNRGAGASRASCASRISCIAPSCIAYAIGCMVDGVVVVDVWCMARGALGVLRDAGCTMDDARDASLSLPLARTRSHSLPVFMRVSMGKGSAQLGRDAR